MSKFGIRRRAHASRFTISSIAWRLPLMGCCSRRSFRGSNYRLGWSSAKISWQLLPTDLPSWAFWKPIRQMLKALRRFRTTKRPVPGWPPRTKWSRKSEIQPMLLPRRPCPSRPHSRLRLSRTRSSRTDGLASWKTPFQSRNARPSPTPNPACRRCGPHRTQQVPPLLPSARRSAYRFRLWRRWP